MRNARRTAQFIFLSVMQPPRLKRGIGADCSTAMTVRAVGARLPLACVLSICGWIG